MFGIGFILFICLSVFFLSWIISFVPAGKSRKLAAVAIIGILVAYPFIYRISPSYAKFHELCDRSDRYQVVSTIAVSYPFLDRNAGDDCKGGPKFIENKAFQGFECIGPNTRTTTAIFRYTKKPSWHSVCGIECFDVEKISVPEVRVQRGYRQGYIDGNDPIVTYDMSGIHADESRSTKLTFSDTILFINGIEMALSRSYTYYLYGNGFAKILGGSSGSAPSESCKQYAEIDIRDIYLPKS